MDKRTRITMVLIVLLCATLSLTSYAIYGDWPRISHATIASALCYFFSMVVAIGGLYISRPPPVADRGRFHGEGSNIYSNAEKHDYVFAITDSFDIPEEYERAYEACRAQEIHFFGPVVMHSPTILGVLARTGILSRSRSDKTFSIKDVPRRAFKKMPPKLAGSTRELVFGEKLGHGKTISGWPVKSEPLASFLWQSLQKLTSKWRDAEEIIATYLDKELDGGVQSNSQATFREIKTLIYEKFVSLEEIQKYWKEHSERITKLAAAGLKHILEVHCIRTC